MTGQVNKHSLIHLFHLIAINQTKHFTLQHARQLTMRVNRNAAGFTWGANDGAQIYDGTFRVERCESQMAILSSDYSSCVLILWGLWIVIGLLDNPVHTFCSALNVRTLKDLESC